MLPELPELPPLDGAPTPANGGRDARGRFAPGNPGGPGNPYVRRCAELRAAFIDALTPADLRNFARKLLGAAKGGDVAAMKLVLAYTVGRPADVRDLDADAKAEAACEAREAQRAAAEAAKRAEDLDNWRRTYRVQALACERQGDAAGAAECRRIATLPDAELEAALREEGEALDREAEAEEAEEAAGVEARAADHRG